MERVAIVGAHGYIGGAVSDVLEDRAQVVRCVRTVRAGADVGFDFWRDDLSRTLAGMDVDTVVFAARVHPSSASGRPALDDAYKQAVDRIVRACVYRHLVLLSTDAVFDGARGGYGEDERPRPTTAHGKSALWFEDAVASGVASHCIARLSYVFGFSRGAIDPRLGAAWRAAATANPFPAYTDMFRSPVDVNDTATAIAELAARRAQGAIHVAGDRLSAADFFRRGLAALGASTDHLSPGPLPADSTVPRDTSIRVRRLLEETSVAPRTVEEALDRELEEKGATG